VELPYQARRFVRSAYGSEHISQKAPEPDRPPRRTPHNNITPAHNNRISLRVLVLGEVRFWSRFGSKKTRFKKSAVQKKTRIKKNANKKKTGSKKQRGVNWLWRRVMKILEFKLKINVFEVHVQACHTQLWSKNLRKRATHPGKCIE
jgi:hypothetical protein